MRELRPSVTVLLLCVLLPGLALAFQEPGAAPSEPASEEDVTAPAQPAPDESVPAPPLVPAEAAPAPDVPAAPRQALEPRQDSPVPLGTRVFGELLGASVTGATGLIMGGIVANNLSSCEGEGCILDVFLGALIGAAAAVPVGVYGAGRLMGVQADASALGGSYLGMGLGGGAALAVSLLIAEDSEVNILAVPVTAVVGAIVGFEVAASLSDSDAPAPRPGPALLLTPTLGTTPRGGFMGGLSGRF